MNMDASMSANATRTRLVVTVATLLTLGGCGDPEPAVSAADEVVDETVGAITAGPTRCPSLTVRRTGGRDLAGQPVALSTTAVPGPLSARIINNGRQITCSPTSTANLHIYTTPWERRLADTFVQATPQGSYLKLEPPLPYQATPQGFMQIQGFFFTPGELRLEGAGWPSRTVASVTEFDHSQSGGYFWARARLYAKQPLTLTQTRPSDLVSTSGDRFIYRCELSGTARRNACSSLCSQQCTANIGYPPDPAGINACIAGCTNTCASDAGCPPIFCSGSDCPSGCSPANVCTTNAQCGGGRTCSAGCCLTIIR
jgi:hypothetical protein